MEEQNKSHFWRFAAGLAALMALGLGIYYATGWYKWQSAQNEATANDRALQDIKEWEAQYENDTYGGTTPEETLALFIDALKKGDIDLASKYFVVDERRIQLEYLTKLKQNDAIQRAINEMTQLQLTKKTDEIAFFTLVENKFATAEVVVGRATNGTWKILEL